MGKKKTEEVVEAPTAPDADAEEEDTPVITALKAIDDKYCAIECEFEQEAAKLRKKYFNERQAPLLVERANVLADTASSPAEDNEFGTPACKGFWLQAFQNADAFAECLEEWDEPVLQYLKDIKKSDLDDAVPQKGFKLEFLFKENPFFSNDALWLEYHVDYDAEKYKPYLEPECSELKGSIVEWKAGKDVTVEVVAKKTKGGGAKKAKQKAKAKEEPRESFFRLLFRNLKVGDPAPEDLAAMMGGGQDDDDDDDEDLVKMILEQLHGIGLCIADEIIPYAVRFYTGEAGDKDDDDDEESEEEDDDDDDDEDEDSDEEPPAKNSGKKKAQKNAAPAAAGGKKEEECKQQ